MKMRVIILTMLVALFLAVGCGRKAEPQYAALSKVAYEDASASYSWEGAGFMPEEVSYGRAQQARTTSGRGFNVNNDADSGISAELPDAERKLVKSASVSIRVENLEKADTSVNSLLESFNGYSASTSISENSHYYSLRIPAPRYDIFLSEMNGMGRITHRSESVEDVTLRYYDLEGRLNSKRELLRTFQSYLRRANNMEEILKVEAQISNLQQEIESIGTQLLYLANQIDYATIELRLHGPAAATPYQHETFGEKIKQLFGGFGSFLSSVAVILLGFVVYGIPSLAIAVLLFWLLFGRIGLLKKLWKLVMVKKQG